ncbi:MAG: AGE family epimerase/isomerase [Pseudomonadota bacterium]
MENSIFDEMREWLFDQAIPFWTAHGPDRQYGGFVEALTFDGKDAALPYKRTRVTCRQIYVFSHAKIVGVPKLDELIDHGVAYLSTNCRQSDGGFIKTTTREGAPLDPTYDLYDNAFAIFAFAWAFRATKNPTYRVLLDEAFVWVKANMRHTTGVGFQHQVPPQGYRAQNPHMHLLEACLAAYETTSDATFAECAHELVDLFKDHLFDENTTTLTEFFKDDLTPAPGPEGNRVEPGHHFEWAWILEVYGRLFDTDTAGLVKPLCKFAEDFGLNPTDGAVMNAVDRKGAAVDPGSRSWPNTERLKAAVSLFRLGITDPMPLIESSGRLLLDRYIQYGRDTNMVPGVWIDSFDASGARTAENVPASILYHLFFAFSEVLSIEGSLGTKSDSSSK